MRVNPSLSNILHNRPYREIIRNKINRNISRSRHAHYTK
jgi:hypothetical protein